MKEALNQWDFVIAAYAVGILATSIMISWAWVSMRRAENRRESVRKK
jgi:hypothetical protein